MTQRALADAMGYAPPSLSRIEHGGTNPRLSTLLVLAEALDTTVSRLTRGV
jgi:transcriptional regulator with XRE-family HTH domain